MSSGAGRSVGGVSSRHMAAKFKVDSLPYRTCSHILPSMSDSPRKTQQNEPSDAPRSRQARLAALSAAEKLSEYSLPAPTLPAAEAGPPPPPHVVSLVDSAKKYAARRSSENTQSDS